MTREAQRQQTFQLVALRDVDRLRAQTTQLIEAVPRVLAGRRRESHAAQAGLEAARLKLQGFKSHLKTLELDLAEREAALGKANGNLLGAKTNQEYSLLQGEIARKRDEKGQGEEKILEQFEVIKQGEQLVLEAEARLAEAEKEFKAFEDRAHDQLAEHQKELAAQDERREQIRKAIAPVALKVYDRAYGAHGEGVVAIENNICQGCFSSITPNDRSRLLSNLELMVCRSCQRIIYLPEALQASPAG
ncbi:MAG: zinc ribbon domain-containing protein [Planctomycetota bacterium]